MVYMSRSIAKSEQTLPALDPDGHLQDSRDWSPAVAEALAERDGIRLESEHWWLIRFVRDHHARHGIPPLMREVIRAMRGREGWENASSRTLYQLLPDGPIRLACRYGGLPKPDSCI